MKTMTLGQRVRSAREAAGLQRKDVAAKAGMSYSALADIENGNTKECRSIASLATALGVSAMWLETGRGGHHISETPPPPYIPQGAAVGAWEHPDDLDPDVHVLIPHFDIALSAGHGTPAEWMQHTNNDPISFRLGWLRYKQLNPANLRGLHVRGDSMSPYLEDGDTVVIDVSQTGVKDNEIYAVLYHGELFVKRLFRLPGGSLRIKSDNPSFDAVDVRGEELELLTILGRKVWRGG